MRPSGFSLEQALTSQGRLRIEVLCEDSEHEAFARCFFDRLHGVDSRRMHFLKAPKGQGAASQWVVKQFEELARRAGAKRHQARLGFLAVVDGDNVGSSKRKANLLADVPRAPGDRIAIWAPTWEIETWVLWLTGAQVGGQDVDESRSFKAELPPERYRDKLQEAVDAWDPPHRDEQSRMPSLADARDELKHIV